MITKKNKVKNFQKYVLRQEKNFDEISKIIK